MGRRGRARNREQRLTAPTSRYESPDGSVLELRGVLTAKTRALYHETLHGNLLSREDAWQRAVELLFERLVVRWTIAGVATEGERALLARFRAATADERRWVRDVIREHVAEHFPEVQAP